MPRTRHVCPPVLLAGMRMDARPLKVLTLLVGTAACMSGCVAPPLVASAPTAGWTIIEPVKAQVSAFAGIPLDVLAVIDAGERDDNRVGYRWLVHEGDQAVAELEVIYLGRETAICTVKPIANAPRIRSGMQAIHLENRDDGE